MNSISKWSLASFIISLLDIIFLLLVFFMITLNAYTAYHIFMIVWIFLGIASLIFPLVAKRKRINAISSKLDKPLEIMSLIIAFIMLQIIGVTVFTTSAGSAIVSCILCICIFDYIHTKSDQEKQAVEQVDVQQKKRNEHSSPDFSTFSFKTYCKYVLVVVVVLVLIIAGLNYLML